MNDSARDKDLHLVFVYGTLKGMDRTRRWSGLGKHLVYKGRATTFFPTFTLHGGSFPVANRLEKKTKDSGKILGEVFEVCSKLLTHLDAYEGAPGFYESEPVALQMEKDGSDVIALMYLGRSVNNTLDHRPIIKPTKDSVLYWPYPTEHKP